MKTTLHLLCFALVLLVHSTFALNAQEPLQISGQVKDDQSKENLPYCKVVAYVAMDSLVGGGITDENGFFNLPLNPGEYTIVISSIGYESDTIRTDFLQEDNFLGVFRLKSSVLDIDEVNVTASSRVDMLEKDVQIITDEQKVGATAAKDVLNKIAGISYDDYSGTLKVDNDANIMILVNGVEKSQEYIQNLDPERLVRVETIRDPGGRYGLEGYTAIINIILKRDYRGSELYLEQMQLVDIVDKESRLDYMIGSLVATYNYTRNDLNIYGSAQLARRNFKVPIYSTTAYADGTVVEEKPLSQTPNAFILEKDAYYTLGFDYRINPKHIISFESTIQALPLSSTQEDVDYQTSVYSNDSLIEAYDFFSNNKTRTFEGTYSLFYIADFNERTKLNVNFTFSNYSDSYQSISAQEGYYDREENGTNKKQYTRGYVELDRILSKKLTLQVGYGNTWRELNNTFDVDIVDPNTGVLSQLSSDFELTDTRHKLYSNLSWKMGEKWSSRVGIAGETSSPRAMEQQLHYVIYQPMFDLRYVQNKKINYVLKYRTSSAYPSIEETNPFTSLINPRLTSTGNPFLRPSITHEFSLRINILEGLLAVEPYTNYSANTIVNVGELDANNIFNFRFENAKLYQQTGATLNFSKFFNAGILIQSNVDVFYNKIISTSKTNSLMDWKADLDLIYIFMKSETLLGIKYQRHQSKMINGLGYDKGDVDFWMLFYKQPLFKKRASVMFGYFLPLNFATNYTQGFYAETTGISMRTDNDVSLVKNMFILEFSFRLSKGKSVKTTEKEILQEKEDGGGGIF